jgi:hypothetical protein
VRDLQAVEQAIGGAQLLESGVLLRQRRGGVLKEGGGQGDGTLGAAWIAQLDGGESALRQRFGLQKHCWYNKVKGRTKGSLPYSTNRVNYLW